MIDKFMEVIEQYDVVVNKAVRGRGAVILDTNDGYKKFYEYFGTAGRAKYEYELLNYIKDRGYENVDGIIPNKEGELISGDGQGNMFVLKEWFYGRECNVSSEQDILIGAENLACLHNITKSVDEQDIRELTIKTDSMFEEYNKHNTELKRIRNYMRTRKHKVEFEYDILRHFDEYYDYAENALKKLKTTKCMELEQESIDRNSICHGNYSYHNILFMNNKTATTGFERSGAGLLIKDLYFYLRKVMEKHNWNLKLGYDILDRYDKIRTISTEEQRILQVMLMYPEKFWKVVNHYYNSNKSWIPDKNVEKLKVVYTQQNQKEEFLTKIWSF